MQVRVTGREAPRALGVAEAMLALGGCGAASTQGRTSQTQPTVTDATADNAQTSDGPAAAMTPGASSAESALASMALGQRVASPSS